MVTQEMPGKIFELFIFICILLSIALAVLETVAPITDSDAWENGLQLAFQVMRA
eukprot:COSAG05_NODE_500_length_9234_cov_107.281664_15_plen_54_part_00